MGTERTMKEEQSQGEKMAREGDKERARGGMVGCDEKRERRERNMRERVRQRS